MRQELLFYSAYEQFYQMADESEAFGAYCRDAFGADFSQDGFSDLSQVNRILPHIPRNARVLDIGCGNGRMLRYLQEKTGASVWGFDYSDNAIRSARAMGCRDAVFTVGVMGEIEYPPECFDVITAMDSLYFAPDMTAFVGQIKRWLKPSGVLCAGYQEGDVMPRTGGLEDTVLARALAANGMHYEAVDLSRETWALMRRKREAAIRHRETLCGEGHQAWFDLLMAQTEHSLVPWEEYRAANARYFFVAERPAD